VALSTNRNVESEIGFRRGFDRFEWHNDLPTDDVFALLRGWKRDLPDDRPHFVYIHLMDPHGPYVQHSPYRERFALHEDDRGFASYLSEVRFMDRHLSRIFRLFNDGNTLFVFVTDHGEEFHDHGNTLHGPYLYAELNRAAMMMYGPGLGVAPRRITENVSLVDVLPTLMDAIGSPMSERPSGTSLWPIVTGDSAAPAVLDELSRRLLFAHRSEPTPPYAESWAALRGPWKYIEHAGREPELYERDQDPAERNNLAQDEPDRVAPLARAIDSARSVSVIGQAGAVTVPMDDSLRETLEALGYAK
jgi:arylsulfatase A-like enzyme